MIELKCPNCGHSIPLNETEYSVIAQQVRSAEFDDAVHKETERVREAMEAKFNADLKSALTEAEAVSAQSEQKLREELAAANARNTQFEERLNRELDAQRQTLEARHAAVLEGVKAKAEAEASRETGRLTGQLADANLRIAKLEGDLQAADGRKEMAVLQAVTQEQARAAETKQELEVQLAYYKDLKTRMSTKMVGESLEQHCLTEFNRIRAVAFPGAYFEKDNTVSATGSKGDFIFREEQDGVELISIMFEMKNEMDTTEKKHRNEDFLKELDRDRKEKNCEYAVLVSMLEADSEYYNDGIVDMSHKYPKMYVIRPQFFIPMISILRNAALNAMAVRHELRRYQTMNMDVMTFEQNVLAFKQNVSRNYELASKQFQTAIDEIDKSISHLQKVRDSLVSSERNLRLLNDKTEDLSIRRLTKGAPEVQRMFEDAGGGQV